MKKIKVKELKDLVENQLGQHLTEFLILFLAVAVGFVGTQLYLRRGVNAKLKHVELQLNKSVGASGSSGSQAANPCHPVSVRLIDPQSGQTAHTWNFSLSETVIARWDAWAGRSLLCCGFNYSGAPVDPVNSSCALAGTAPFCAGGFCLSQNNLPYRPFILQYRVGGGNIETSDPQIGVWRCQTDCSVCTGGCCYPTESGNCS